MRRVSLLVVLVACGRSGVYRYGNEPNMSFEDAGLDGGFDAGTFDAGVKPCTPGHITLEKATPVTILVLDRSSSMGFRLDTSTRWKVLTDGLAKALPPVDQTMQIGALIFPLGGGGAACIASASLDFTPATGNVSSIIQTMKDNGPSGSTPTAQALDVAGTAITAIRAARSGRALVLATDGAPDCNFSLDPFTCTCVSNQGASMGNCESSRCLDDARTVGRIAHFADAGVPTYVIGIDTGADEILKRVLTDMAVAGGRPQADAGTKFYAVSSQAQLDSALVTIRDSVGACTYLSSSVPYRDDKMTVTIEGVGVVPFDPTSTNGWAWSDRANGEVLLTGAACDRLKATMQPVLTADVSCEQ